MTVMLRYMASVNSSLVSTLQKRCITIKQELADQHFSAAACIFHALALADSA